MRKRLLFAALIAAVLFSAVLAGCGGGKEVKLENWQSGIIEVVCGETVNLELGAAGDTNGNLYEVTAVVKDADGQEIEYTGGSFEARDKRGYTIIYTAKIDEKKFFTRTVAVTVKDAVVLTDGTTAASAEILTGESYAPEFKFDSEGGTAYEETAEGRSSDEGIATVADGVIYAVSEGTCIVTFDVPGNRITVNVNVIPPFSADLIKISEKNYKRVAWGGSLPPEYVSESMLVLEGFSGEYSGNAVRFPYFNNTFRVKTSALYSRTVKRMGDGEYDYVSMNILFDISDEGFVSLFNDNGKSLVGGLNSSIVFKKSDSSYLYNTWYEIRIPFNALKSVIEEDGTVHLFNCYSEGVTGGSGNYIYFGNIALGKTEELSDSLITVAASTYSQISPLTGTALYMPASALAEKNFTGGYTGNAAVINGGSNDNIISVKLGKGIAEAIKNDTEYDFLEFRMLYDADPEIAEGVMWAANGESTLLNEELTFTSAGVYRYKNWHTVKIPFARVKQLIPADGTLALFIAKSYGYAAFPDIYIGDVTLGKNELSGNLFIIDETNFTGISWGGGSAPTYASKESLAEKGFEGDYAGNAVEYGFGVNYGFSVQPELKDSLSEFDTLSFWFLVDFDTGFVWLSADDKNNLAGKLTDEFHVSTPDADKNAYPCNFKTWYKVTVPVSAVSEVIDENGKIILFAVTAWESAGNGKVYIGDITLNKNAAE